MKINDRLILGVLSGLLANIPKLIIARTAIKYKVSEINGPEIAGGMFIPPHKLATPLGKAVGWFADSVISGMLGVTTVYLLSITGKDKYILKGLLAGQIIWQGLYGILGSMGVSQVRPYSPKTVITEAISHTIYGVTATIAAVKLGDEKLFTGETPMSASNQEQTSQPSSNEQSQEEAPVKD